MKYFTYKDITYVVIAILLFPIIYYAPLYMKYRDIEINKLKNIENEKVVIIYDNFKVDHGELITNIFTTAAKAEYEIIKLDQTEIRVETLSLVVKNLIEQNKQIFINASVNPKDGVYSSIWKNTFIELAQIDAIKITQSIGNQLPTDLMLHAFTSKLLAKELDQKIYDKLNMIKNEIRMVAENEMIDKIITDYGVYGVLYASLYNHIFDDRNTKMHKLVQEIVHPILEEHKLTKHEEEISKIYSTILIRFSYSILLQQNNSKVMLVSSSSQFIEDPEDDFFLDLKVDLVENKARFPALSYVDQKPIFGTSISAPLALASYMNQNLKDE